ncbi:MAG: hypothetical protein SFV15_24960 [Polyangiaceae bacterium]|nr:hypothetical protein [Polyangiaceae bacterium]
MKTYSCVEAGDREEVFRLLARLIAPYLTELGQTEAELYYDQHTSPLGKRRHLNLARRGALPAHKVGRRVLVRHVDVHAYIVAHRVPAVAYEPDSDPLADWELARKEAP